MSEQPAKQQTSEDFLMALSTYSECIKPYLRTAQRKYVAPFWLPEDHDFDFSKYCTVEKKVATDAAEKIKSVLATQ